MAGWGLVSKVLGDAKDFKGVEVSNDITDEDLSSNLANLGVEVSSDDTREDKLRCCSVLSSEDYWRQFYSLHATGSRVKKWMWVHERYRKYLDDMVSKAENATGLEGGQFLNVRKQLEKDFGRFESKIDKHSDFEDNQLFRFFLENAADGCETELKSLIEEHQDRSKVDAVRQGLTKGAEGSSELLAAIKEYSEGMKTHLEEEERVLVRRWMCLSAAEYKKYRSYLSWKYSLMY